MLTYIQKIKEIDWLYIVSRASLFFPVIVLSYALGEDSTALVTIVSDYHLALFLSLLVLWGGHEFRFSHSKRLNNYYPIGYSVYNLLFIVICLAFIDFKLVYALLFVYSYRVFPLLMSSYNSYRWESLIIIGISTALLYIYQTFILAATFGLIVIMYIYSKEHIRFFDLSSYIYFLKKSLSLMLLNVLSSQLVQLLLAISVFLHVSETDRLEDMHVIYLFAGSLMMFDLIYRHLIKRAKIYIISVIKLHLMGLIYALVFFFFYDWIEILLFSNTLIQSVTLLSIAVFIQSGNYFFAAVWLKSDNALIRISISIISLISMLILVNVTSNIQLIILLLVCLSLFLNWLVFLLYSYYKSPLLGK